jgi:hypothetical protein
VRPIVKPIIDLMLFSSMFPFVNGILLAGSLANLGSLTSKSGILPSTASDHPISDEGWESIRGIFE